MDDETSALHSVTPTLPPPAIYSGLVAVMGDLAKTGISKDRKNETQHFLFRGIDDVMNAVSPIMAKRGIALLMRYTDYPDVERVTGKGSTLIYSKVRGDFTFVSALDGSYASVSTFGVAMDSGDKAMNKAMSAALKYALLQTFLVPTESGEDADASTPEATVPAPPSGFAEWFPIILAVAEEGFDELRGAWKDSPEEFRTYAMNFRADEWNAAKKHANQVTAAVVKSAAPDALPAATPDVEPGAEPAAEPATPARRRAAAK